MLASQPAIQINMQSQILKQWADFDRDGASRASLFPVDWQPATAFMRAAQAADEAARQTLKELLARSDLLFGPLGDPLSMDFGAHRWLAESREESYSDWLAWILAQIGEPIQILRLFGVSDESVSEPLSSRVRVREIEILDRSRRLDLLLPFGDQLVVVVEIKTKWFGREEVREQLTEYAKWADQQPAPALCFFVAVELDAFQCPETFTFVPWRDLSLRLRAVALEWIRGAEGPMGTRLISAAMLLAFCGSVEQNLLELSSERKKFSALASTQYLREFLDRIGEQNNE